MTFNKLVKEAHNSIHFKCVCGTRVATMFFNRLGYLDISNVDVCPGCGIDVDVDAVCDSDITQIQ